MSTPVAKKPTLDKPIVDNEEDLDDLDDVLSEFGAGAGVAATQPISIPIQPKSPPPPPPPTATASALPSSSFPTSFSPASFPAGGAAAAAAGSSGRPRTNTRVDAPPASIPGPTKKNPKLDSTAEEDEGEEGVLSSDDFAKELAREMENLVREIAGDAPASVSGGTQGGEGAGDGDEEKERARAFKAAWEAMLVEGMNANMGLGEDGRPVELQQPSSSSAPNRTAAAGGDTSFQDRIKQATNKLKESESKFQGAPTSADGFPGDADTLQELLKTLGDLGLGEGEDKEGLGEGSGEEQLAGMLEGLMGQLMSKEVLYEPLKELSDNFPPYLANPPSPLTPEDRTRYDSQLTCVRKILAVFENEKYSDADADMNKKVVDLMSEMQTFGTPPQELMGPLPPGLDGTNPLFGVPGAGDENCVVA
ncbi:Pex19 protein family-domain-containing protein [Gymnopilus junonius]|uniref:Pex19 protein family-domain-containing protein n=1 Tax=Gymnopilus junonius TaxID=109634 RepID=A0A9P5NNB4_GYMJU|nr:Pex19 protein family-domain-containing protein [Gymnopilus junonius]